MHPQIIQGGMGVAVSSWRLAQTVARLGQLGVVSGTAVAVVLARRLQLGDPEGHIRRALDHFPYPTMAQRVLASYFVPGGKGAQEPFLSTPVPTLRASSSFEQLTCVGAFVEVFLAKEGHAGRVGMNLLSKIQLPTLPALYGALLAGVDAILMGAGVPVQIPEILDQLAAGAPASLRIDVDGALPGEEFHSCFDPAAFVGGTPLRLTRPLFLAIISSSTLAQALLRRSKGEVDGFVVERDSAGGHNAPPRGARVLTALGEPLYGPRDIPDLEAIRALGRPFWLAGAYGTPEGLAEALRLGAAGIQVGTAFAFCDESGITPEIKREVIARVRRGEAQVFTDPDASPTGFPFKVVQLPGSLSEAEVVADRPRLCDLGYLRHPYRREDGSVGYRCPSEPVEDYLRKGGSLEDTVRRVCVCNGLPGVVGFAQQRAGRGPEPVLLTAGNALTDLASWCTGARDGYAAADVVARILAGPAAAGI